MQCIQIFILYFEFAKLNCAVEILYCNITYKTDYKTKSVGKRAILKY